MSTGMYDDNIQVADSGKTVWVHAADGSTVGRFDRHFGLDVHNTATAQIAGAPECIYCTHAPAGATEWALFCRLMLEHHNIAVPSAALSFD